MNAARYLASRPSRHPALGQSQGGQFSSDNPATAFVAFLAERRADVVDGHPHRFRHDAARRLVEATDLPTVAARLGHERLDTVRIYSQPDEAALERAAVLLEAR